MTRPPQPCREGTLIFSYPPAFASASHCPNPTTRQKTGEQRSQSEGSASRGIWEGGEQRIQVEISSPRPSDHLERRPAPSPPEVLIFKNSLEIFPHPPPPRPQKNLVEIRIGILYNLKINLGRLGTVKLNLPI